MKRLSVKQNLKRGCCALLAALLCVCSSWNARAEENLLETQSAAYTAASNLLVTGGHETYMSGYSGRRFLPEKEMTRAEVAKMLYNLLITKPTVTESRFSDVSMSDWFGVPVNALAALNVLIGYRDGSFEPTKTITRAEFIVALSRCFTMGGGEVSFTDVPSSHWACKEISAAASMGWINGVGNGEFQPARAIRRSEVVKVMNIALGRTGDGFASRQGGAEFVDVPPSHWAYRHVLEAAEPLAEADPSPTPTPTPSTGGLSVGCTVRVTATSGLNLRSGPDTSYSRITTMSLGTRLTVTNLDPYPWIGVRTSAGQTGFVSSEYVEFVSAPSAGGTDTPAATGVSVNPGTITLHQYQSARLDGSVNSGLSSMQWISSDPNICRVGYVLDYGGSNTQGAMLYGVSPGSCTITFTDGKSSSGSCRVNVISPETVRYAYGSDNSPIAGRQLQLIAVAEETQTAVTFQIRSGPATGTYTTGSYTTETRRSNRGLPTTVVRVFQANVTFGLPGMYTIRASAGNDYKDFTVLVRNAGETVTDTDVGERRCSTEGLKIIAQYEGTLDNCAEIYDDPLVPGHPTVGYGYVVPVGGTFYNTLTPTELFAMLVDQVNDGGYGKAINRMIENYGLKMSQGQFDALCDFTYNCGPGVLSPGTYDTPKVMLNAVAPPAGLSETNPRAGRLNIENATLYREPDYNSAAVTTLPEGSTFHVTALVEKPNKQFWYRVVSGENSGYIPSGLVQLSGSDLVRDLAYVDAGTFANQLMQWNMSGGVRRSGHLYRRMAEAKMFFFGNYAEAYKSNARFQVNTYGFRFPSNMAQYEIK